MNQKYARGALIIFLVLIVVYMFAVWRVFPDMTSRGQFGDMFGAINAIFSGLAFLGVVYAIFLQSEDLRMQREELKLTREELKRTAEAQEKSEKALSKQAASLKVTAKLNGLSAVLQHYNTLLALTNSAKYGIDHLQFTAHKQKADRIIVEIESLIEGK